MTNEKKHGSEKPRICFEINSSYNYRFAFFLKLQSLNNGNGFHMTRSLYTFMLSICAVLLQTDLAKKEEESVEPIPQISDFVIDDLRKYVAYFL